VSNIEKQSSSTWFAAENRSALIQEYGIFLAFLLLALILSISNQYFQTPGKYRTCCCRRLSTACWRSA
jgi:putative xylitol transport system permease protein